ncbi:unnamed protein product [Schistosoma turkestanicum]|nr:unnamed protein product [Schistosoma turkestanicum]
MRIKLSTEWNCCSSDIFQESSPHPLPSTHPAYKLHTINATQWSLYLFNINLILTNHSNESDNSNSVIIKHHHCTDSTSLLHQSTTIKRSTHNSSNNPVTLGVSVSIRRLSNNNIDNNNSYDSRHVSDVVDSGRGCSSSSSSTTVVNGQQSSVPSIETVNNDNHLQDTQYNAVFVRTVIDGGPAYQDGRLQVGDRLLSIDGQNLSGLSTTDALNRLKSVIAKDLNKSPNPCVHLLIARPRDGINSDNSYANSMENTSDSTINKSINSNQRKSSSEVITKESHDVNSVNSKPLLVSAVVHSSEPVTVLSGNSHASPVKYSLSSNTHRASTNIPASSSSSSYQSNVQNRSTNQSNTSYPLCINHNSQVRFTS